MNKEVKTAWLAALRSGKYEQIAGELQNSEGYCCLGVLCKLAERYDVTVTKEDNRIVGCDITNDQEAVARWAEIEELALQSHLIHMNDDEGKTFEEIAEYIEEKL